MESLTLGQRIAGLAALGTRLTQQLGSSEIEPVLSRAAAENGWFSPDQSRAAIQSLAEDMLKSETLNAWASRYALEDKIVSKKIGLVMAGNIPLVGMHDLFAVLLSGHRALIVASSKDEVLTEWMISQIEIASPGLGKFIEIAEKLTRADAVIATGSNNTMKYFQQYFSKKPHILRGSKTSAAVITGKETEEDFEALGREIFSFYGLGCRNVSKLFVPEGYDFVPMLDAFRLFAPVVENNKYWHNYEYYKAIYLVNRTVHLDTGFLLVKADTASASPPGNLFYQTYGPAEPLAEELSAGKQWQCIYSAGKVDGVKTLPFGEGQHPNPWDYADNTDTIAFLLSLGH